MNQEEVKKNRRIKAWMLEDEDGLGTKIYLTRKEAQKAAKIWKLTWDEKQKVVPVEILIKS